jgi:tetratricopeptide (TPR) repeat protein
MRILKFGLVLGLAFGGYQAVRANGSSMPAASPAGSASDMTMSPEDMARTAYNNGIDHRDKGRKLEEQAAKQQGKDHDKSLDKARDEFGKALKEFQTAAKLSPEMYQAYNGMGYAYRKTGDYPKALEMYDQALKMAPGFPDALEYRGEAYLGLNRLDDAKQAYLDLFAKDRKQADQLLTAMSAWISQHEAGGAGVDASTVASLDSWVKERAKIATTTVAMALTSDQSIWK